MSMFTVFISGAKNVFNSIFSPESVDFNTIIPNEVKKKIFDDHMTKKDHLTLRQVCKSWHNLTESEVLPRLIDNRKLILGKIEIQTFINQAMPSSDITYLKGERVFLEGKKEKYETQLEELKRRLNRLN